MYRNYISEYNLCPDDVLVYLRKSRADDPLLTVEEVLSRHESILDEWAEKNLGARVPEDNKFREVVSGETIADRPEVQKLLRLIESPRFKAVLVVEVPRLSRGDLEDAGRLMKLFRYTNTLVITPQWIFDLQEEHNRDGFERELKRGNEYLEYTKHIMNRGTLRSVSEGNYLGSIAPYGYDRVWITEGKRKCPTLAINEEQANVVRMIFDLHTNQNMGAINIGHRLDELGIKAPKGDHWSSYAIRNMLSNIHYIGKIKWNCRKTATVVEDGEIRKTRPTSKMGDYLVFEGKHEAIITEELFYATQEKLNKHPKLRKNMGVRNPLAGLLYCQCGRAMSLRIYKDKNGGERNAPRLLCDGQEHCHVSSCLYSEMIDIVKKVLSDSISDFERRIDSTTDDAIKYHEKLLKSLEKKLQDIEAREISQWEAQSHPDESQRMPPHIFKMLNEKLLKEKDEVKEAIKNARNTMPTVEDFGEKKVRFQKALDALNDPELDAGIKNKLLKDCIARIDYSREKATRSRRAPGEAPGTTIKTAGGHWDVKPINIDIKLKV
ncbi:MAG: recombinase family protein [Clostridia bacterium]|nr:recombinase family protein [Clostridia bacterium]